MATSFNEIKQQQSTTAKSQGPKPRHSKTYFFTRITKWPEHFVTHALSSITTGPWGQPAYRILNRVEWFACMNAETRRGSEHFLLISNIAYGSSKEHVDVFLFIWERHVEQPTTLKYSMTPCQSHWFSVSHWFSQSPTGFQIVLIPLPPSDAVRKQENLF